MNDLQLLTYGISCFAEIKYFNTTVPLNFISIKKEP